VDVYHSFVAGALISGSPDSNAILCGVHIDSGDRDSALLEKHVFVALVVGLSSHGFGYGTRSETANCVPLEVGHVGLLSR
jgi:hypothetical protein